MSLSRVFKLVYMYEWTIAGGVGIRDAGVCKSVQSCNHCLLHQLFSAKTEQTRSTVLRPGGKNFALTSLKSEFAKKSFVNRSLFV